jgi:hypothetical protein
VQLVFGTHLSRGTLEENFCELFARYNIAVVDTEPIFSSEPRGPTTPPNVDAFKGLARKWARSWVTYKDPNSPLEEIRRCAQENKNLFDFLPLPDLTELNTGLNTERMVSLYIAGVNLTEQKGFLPEHKTWLEHYVRMVTTQLSENLCGIRELVLLTIAFL